MVEDVVDYLKDASNTNIYMVHPAVVNTAVVASNPGTNEVHPTVKVDRKNENIDEDILTDPIVFIDVYSYSYYGFCRGFSFIIFSD